MLSRRAAAATVCLGLTLSVFALLFPLGNPARSPAAPEPEAVDAEPADLAPQLYLQWVRDLPVLRPAWPDQPLLQFDVAYQPVVVGDSLFLASSEEDGVAAFDAETGDALWRFFTDGPVRFAPVVWEEKVYFASDDGWLYCVSADKGALVWKFRGAPSDRKVLGNGRLISAWPARGAPVVVPEPSGGAIVYFGAGIWPFMGVFLHALDARTGAVRWTNGGDGSLYIKQPHMVDSFGGVAPQGRLAVVGDRLLVPCGRSIPACYDRRSGKLLHFRLADDSKLGGGAEIVAGRRFFVSGGGAFDLASGSFLGAVGDHAVLSGDSLFTAAPTELRVFDASLFSSANTPRPLPSAVLPLAGIEAMTATPSRLYVGTVGRVFAVERPLSGGRARISWQTPIEGRPVHLSAADGRLFVSTREGRIYCFGGQGGEILTHPLQLFADALEPDSGPDKAREILDVTGTHDGYCIAWGVGSGRLIRELLRQSRLHIVVIEPDAVRARTFRDALCDAGLYGERAALVQTSPEFADLPPYLAELMVSEDLGAAGVAVDRSFLAKVFASLRPYGGTACLPVGAEDRALVSGLAADVGARVGTKNEWLLLKRDGPLPGAADWTHEHADAANTRCSRDTIVRAPLGLLWFGGPSHDGILPRHGHGPQPQVVGGRLFIEGVDILRAVDVYTGQLLWEASLPGVGQAYDATFHQPGANAGGANYVSARDGIYVAYGRKCVRLDPATGAKTAEFIMPPFKGENDPPVWDWVTLDGDLLIGGADPGPRAPPLAGTGLAAGPAKAVSASKRLAALDRNTGELRWLLTAQTSFRHNGICIGGGRLYAIDRPSADQTDLLKRRGDSPSAAPRLVAVNLHANGRGAVAPPLLWARTDGVFGSWLSYSDKYDILVEAGRNARDTLSDEPKGMRGYRASDGKPLWYQANCSGPAMIHGDMVLRDGGGCDLRTGAVTTQTDPLTGLSVEWAWSRNYGCNTPAASENLLTFRSGAAGYYDLADLGGTGNLGGFRSSCTNNLIVADGLLNAPDYTRGCTCSYQNQGSLALAPMPDAEEWTFFPPRDIKGVIKRIGINLGAPGCRRDDAGVLWLEYPPVGGTDERPAISVSPNNVDWFRRHSSQVQGDGPHWVGASGGKGLRSATIMLSRDPAPARPYRVRLWFMEPDDLRGGRRVFDVAVQGRPVLREFEPLEAAGGLNRVVMWECKTPITVGRDLSVTLTPSGADTTAAPLLCGVEAEAVGW
ncbi:MAG TPA: PQQ-binding-like beta-propeller repeat protein [Gemmataceae bacterium]|nr:PQQ-binding-like beta-propeller repeat protein [Gemmataceae bacterium]